MGIITTNTGRKLFRKASSLVMLPYRYDSTNARYVLGLTAYDLSSIIGDSIALEQGEGTSQIKENEFSAEPLIKNVTTGEWRFTAQCLDLQNNVLRALFAAYFNDNAGIAAIRKDYETIYALIRIRFSDKDIPDVWLPKVLLNSRLLLQQMKSQGSQGTIAGTPISVRAAVIDNASEQTLYGFSDIITRGVVYNVETPVLFCPQTKTPLFLNHEEDGNYYFDEPNLGATNNSSVANNRYVDITTPKKYTILS